MNALEELQAYQADWMKYKDMQPDLIGAFGQMRGAAVESGLDLKTIGLVAGKQDSPPGVFSSRKDSTTV